MRLWPRRKVYLDNLPRTHDVRFATVFLVGFVVLAGGLYGVGYVLAGDRLPSGTTVAGVDVGGMRAGEARTELQSKLVPRLSKPVRAVAAGESFSLDPQESGLTLDIDATIDEALGGGAWDPRHMVQVMTGGGEVDPVVVVDTRELAGALDRIDATIRQDPVDAAVTYVGGQPQVRYAQPGRALDRERAGPRLRAALLAQDRRVGLPVVSLPPAVSSTEASRFAGGPALLAVSAPIRLRIGGTLVALSPRVFAPALKAVATDGRFSLQIDGERLMARSARALSRLPNQPVEARIYFRDGRPAIRKSRPGVSVTPDALATAVRRAVAGTADRTSRVATERLNPQRSTRQAKQLRVESIVAATRVRYRLTPSLGDPSLIARQLNGALLLPGRSLSFGERVDWLRHPRAASLVGSAAYDAGYRAGLAIDERTSLPYYSSSFTAGIDAAVSQAGEALELRNNGPYGVYVRAYVDAVGPRGGMLNVELWSTPYLKVTVKRGSPYNVIRPEPLVDTSDACMPRGGSPGFDIDVRRRLERADGSGRVETTHTRYSPLARIICR